MKHKLPQVSLKHFCDGRPTSGILMSRSGARGPGGEPGSRLDALNSCHEKGFYWQEGGWGSFTLTKWERDIGSTVPRRFQKRDTKNKGQNMSRKEEIWQRPRLYCQSAVKGRRSCDVHWGTGQWILTCLRKTLTLQKTPAHKRPTL